MTQLIANIGNSDLSVKIGVHYLCLGFDRDEPNLKEQEEALSSPDRQIWNSSTKIIAKELCQPLGVPTKEDSVTGKISFHFYNLTQKLYEAYCADFDTWHKRFSFGRILGVINKAIALGATKATFFVTQQEPLHDKDTFYLFQILKRWLEKERPNLMIQKRILPPKISAIDADALFDFYYSFFQDLQVADENRFLAENKGFWLVSCKGGTPQMKTALQLQAMAVANTGGVIFIDPITNLQSMLVGEPSECRQTSYWRYLRSQQYETVKQLLTRWDFDGALQVLMTWQNYLKKLAENDLSDRDDIATSARNLNRMINFLEIGKACRNFDMKTARSFAEQNEALVHSDDLSIRTMRDANEYEIYRVLHLLTHCRIHKELNEAANLLTTLASLNEIVLDLIIENLMIEAIPDEMERHSCFDKRDNIKSEEVGKLLNSRFVQRFRVGLSPGERLPLIKYRHNRRKFIDALIYHLGDRDRRVWDETESELKLFDEWCDMRNKIIHRAEGVNLEQAYLEIKQKKKLCHPDEIIPKLEFICQNPWLGLSDECRNLYTTDGGEYYIYSFLRNEIIQALMDDAL